MIGYFWTSSFPACLDYTIFPIRIPITPEIESSTGKIDSFSQTSSGRKGYLSRRWKAKPPRLPKTNREKPKNDQLSPNRLWLSGWLTDVGLVSPEAKSHSLLLLFNKRSQFINFNLNGVKFINAGNSKKKEGKRCRKWSGNKAPFERFAAWDILGPGLGLPAGRKAKKHFRMRSSRDHFQTGHSGSKRRKKKAIGNKHKYGISLSW